MYSYSGVSCATKEKHRLKFDEVNVRQRIFLRSEPGSRICLNVQAALCQHLVLTLVKAVIVFWGERDLTTCCLKFGLIVKCTWQTTLRFA